MCVCVLFTRPNFEEAAALDSGKYALYMDGDAIQCYAIQFRACAPPLDILASPEAILARLELLLVHAASLELGVILQVEQLHPFPRGETRRHLRMRA